jgi:hypothetical protein
MVSKVKVVSVSAETEVWDGFDAVCKGNKLPKSTAFAYLMGKMATDEEFLTEVLAYRAEKGEKRGKANLGNPTGLTGTYDRKKAALKRMSTAELEEALAKAREQEQGA